MIKILPTLFLITFLIPSLFAQSDSTKNSISDTTSEVSGSNVFFPAAQDTTVEKDTLLIEIRQPIDITAGELDSNASVFAGDKVIEISDTVRNNVVVKGGSLTVLGMIDGNVLVVGGDLNVKSTGSINGNAKVIDGNIFKENGAIIRGYEDKSSAEKIPYRMTRRRISRSVRTFDVPWQDEQTNLDKYVFRYNRVESLFLGVGTEKKLYWDGKQQWSPYGSVGWGFKSHTWRANLGLSQQYAVLSDKGNGIIELCAEIYSLTDTKDQWIISIHENTAAAMVMHEDFRDYFERRGCTVNAAYYYVRNYMKSEFKLSFLFDTYDSLSNKIDWALFGGHKKFRTNPAIEPGNMRSLKLLGGISTITKTSFGPEGWGISATTEFVKRNWHSKFEFDQYIFDVRRFQPLGRYENFNARLRIGTACGTLPLQKLFELGGSGTLNAFPFKSEIGNRMILVNMEFIVNGNILSGLEFWPTWIFEHVNIMLMSDAGFTRAVSTIAPATDGFSNIKWSEFKHNFGVALSNRSGSLRVGFAWRTDCPTPAQFILRVSRPF